MNTLKYFHYFYSSEFGRIGLVATETSLTQLFFNAQPFPAVSVQKETPLLQDAGRQLLEYMNGRRKEFDLPLAPSGTGFFLRVWSALQNIPYGETRSYSEVARVVDVPNAARAVGLANNRNPLPIFIPCHRVVGANQKLTGYRGGLALKQKLLELEQLHAHI